MLSVGNDVKTKRLGMRLSIAVGARRRSHGGLTLIDASGLRLAALEQIITSVPQRWSTRHTIPRGVIGIAGPRLRKTASPGCDFAS